ncbi:MAG TPA: DNA repair protein RecO [Gemmataceae bacterium]|jgi:DNA repair protein RecO (recombination protein O)|nr:DNA repair protein RecO [Gemmataceae bacterium]
MPAEKALALVVRTTDWSETSRIATLFTREFGKVRVLAKGGRRLKSNFETALDLLTVCSIVFLRKSSDSLDLLTEAQVSERFAGLRQSLPALYAGCYVAELLSDGTQDYDPHPNLFDATLQGLRDFGADGISIPLRLAALEMVWLRELGYDPVLENCVHCRRPLAANETNLTFSAAAGGILCRDCQRSHGDGLTLGSETWKLMRQLAQGKEVWRRDVSVRLRQELRRILGHYVTYLLGHRPRLLPYLSSLSGSGT